MKFCFFLLDFLDFCDFCHLKWLGSHRCFSVLAKPFFTTGFWCGQQFAQRDLKKIVEKSKKCDFSTKRDDVKIDRFPGQKTKSVVNSIKIRCKFQKIHWPFSPFPGNDFTTFWQEKTLTARLKWLGSHRCFSVSAKFCKVPKQSKKYMNLQRVLMQFTTNFVVNSIKTRCKNHKFPL